MKNNDREKPTPYEVGAWQHANDMFESKATGSNWPYQDVVEKKREYLRRPTFFVDSQKTGMTIGKFKTWEAAANFAKKINGVMRIWQPTDEQMDEIQRIEKENKQFASTAPHRPLTKGKPKTYKPFTKKN